MKIELITVIGKTIDVLENNKVKYNWYDFENCNCGIVAQQACGITGSSIRKFINESNMHFGLWEYAVVRCQKTGSPMSHVIRRLRDIGLSNRDLINLENLSDRKIIKKAGLDYEYVQGLSPSEGFKQIGQTGLAYKSVLIKYLKAWRELLIEEGESKYKYQPASSELATSFKLTEEKSDFPIRETIKQ